MKRFFCLVLTLTMTLSAISAFAVEFSYEQIVDIVDAIAIDGKKVFTDAEEHVLETQSWELPYDYMGAAFIWYANQGKGILQVFDNIYLEKYTQWNCNDKAHARVIMDVLPYILPEYIYDMGAEITFMLAENENLDNPIAHYHFSPSTTGENSYTDADKFSKAVQTAIDNTVSQYNQDSVSNTEVIPEGNDFVVLSKGSKGDAVVELQSRLNELGYSVGTVDGDFGGKTHNAVCDFQRDNDLEATGIVDAELNALIFSTTAKTKAEVEALKNSPEGFRLDIAAAKAIGDKFASGSFNGSDKCTSNESSSDYRFYVQDYDTKNGELQISCSLDKAKGANNIDANISVEYIIPLGSGLWRSEPNMVVISTNKGSHTLPSSMWSWLAGSVYIDFDEDISLFKEIAGASEFNIVLSNSNPSTLTYGSFSKNSVGFKGIKTVWNIWEAAGCNKLMEMK